MHKLISQVVIEQEHVTVGTIGISVTFNLLGFFAGGSNGLEEEAVTHRSEVKVLRHYLPGTGSREALERLAASGAYTLTDEQWRCVAPLLRQTTELRGKQRLGMFTRRLADAVVFKMRTGVSIGSMPEVFGARRDLARLIPRFIRIGGVRALVDEVGEKDPEWLKRLDLKGLGIHKKPRPKAVISHEEIAKEAARDGRFRITDEQWEAVRDLVPPRFYLRKAVTNARSMRACCRTASS